MEQHQYNNNESSALIPDEPFGPHIPSYLKQLNIWVNWVYDEETGEKIWIEEQVNFDTAIDYIFQNESGVGIILDDQFLVAIEADGVEHWPLISQLSTYIEASDNQAGFTAILLGKIDAARYQNGVSIRNTGFVAITGNRQTKIDEPRPDQAGLYGIIESHFA